MFGEVLQIAQRQSATALGREWIDSDGVLHYLCGIADFEEPSPSVEDYKPLVASV